MHDGMPQGGTGHETEASWADRLLALLDEQQRLVEQIGGLAEQQAKLVEASATEKLLSLLSRRQKLVDRFVATQEQLGGLTEGLDERLEEVEAEMRDAIRGRLDSVSRGLSTILQRDEADQKALEARRTEVGGELGSVKQGQAARNAYRSGRAVNHRFADRKG
jgi:hypothetical protein